MKKCSFCDYVSSRQYNLDRHIYTRHSDNKETNQERKAKREQMLSSEGTNVIPKGTNVIIGGTNVIPDTESLEIYKCEHCYKDFSSKKGYRLHQSRCKSICESLECQYCHKCFTQRSNKSRHEKHCEVRHKQIILSTENGINENQGMTTIHNTTNNIQINNNQQININLLTYPHNGEQTKDFDFVRNHITGKEIKKMFEGKPEIGFSRYIYSIFDRPENRIVQKTHPNNNYSKVHIGDGKWSFELDDDVYTVITHFLTCAALQSTEEHKQFIRTMEKNIRTYLDDVNTQNDENDNYARAMQRVRLIIINLTSKWKQEGLIQN